MAKSLFASLPPRTPKKAVVIQRQNDGSLMEEGNNCHKLGNTKGKFHEFHEAFSSHSRSKFNIGLHMFQDRAQICNLLKFNVTFGFSIMLGVVLHFCVSCLENFICFLKLVVDLNICILISSFTYLDGAAPFKFDVPSPDDLVSNGLHSSKTGSKGILLTCLNYCRNQFLSTLMQFLDNQGIGGCFLCM